MRRWYWLILFVFGCDDSPDLSEMDAGQTKAVEVNSAFEVGASGALLSVWGASADDVYTVGGQPDDGLAWHFDGAMWSSIEIPEGLLLNWVHGVADEVWFVGDGGRALHAQDGAVFEEFETGIEVSLWGAFAAAPDDVWAVGGDAACGDDFDPIITHFDGSVWTRVEVPPVDRDFCALFKVWGATPNDVWAIGAKGVALHWDGMAWSQVSTGTGQDLISLWGRGTDDIIAVGGRGNGVIAHWDGSAWTTEVLDREPGLNGIWFGQNGTAWVAGNSGLLLRIFPDGTRERIVSGTRLILHGIFGLPTGDVFTVGGSLLFSPPWDGIALEVKP